MMKNKILLFLLITSLLSGCVDWGKEKPQFTEEKSKEIAKDFIKNSPTYKFDGFGLVDKKTLYVDMETCSYCWGFIFEFSSRQAGYGDRTGKVLAQVITPHTAIIMVQKGKITHAVLDERWNMLNQELISKEEKKEDFCGSSTYGKCSSDADCLEGGCSGQICQSKDEESKITTCEWRDCYNNEEYGLECSCLDNKCQWVGEITTK